MDDQSFPEIKTGNGIDRDLAATANDRIKKAVIEINGLKSAITSLEKTIVNLDSKNGKLQKRIFWLTVVGVALATTQIVQVIDIIKRWL
jgi:uncharacterized phage infection (PIP) family protein YhgE